VNGRLTSTPMRAVETNTRPSFAVPPLSCDAHIHIFSPDPKYPSVPAPLYTLPYGRLEHYLRLADFLGIARMVLVQPSYYGTDNSCLIDALRVIGSRGRGVVMLADGMLNTDLDRFDQVGVRAIRLDLFSRSSLPREELIVYIRRAVERAKSRGWHIQFYTPGWVARDLISFLATLDIDFVIDHMGYMLEEDGLTERDFDRLLSLFRGGNCWLKLSGPYRLAKHKGYEAVAPVAKAIVATRPDRVLWGSDWPHIPEGSRDTGELLNLLLNWAPEAETRQMILADNPARLFGFDEAS
jgi:2-pyrone-4,6-dicarboxylate lactonase